MYISLASIAVHIPASFGMMLLLSNVGVTPERPNGFGHAGVALATSIVALINFAALSFFMRRRIKRLNGREVFGAVVKIAIASAVMSVVAYVSYQGLANYLDETRLSVRVVEVFVPMAVAGLTFAVVAKLVRISELEKLTNALRKRFAK
jgi:putative peptidoglycan lipid II flippase